MVIFPFTFCLDNVNIKSEFYGRAENNEKQELVIVSMESRTAATALNSTKIRNRREAKNTSNRRKAVAEFHTLNVL